MTRRKFTPKQRTDILKTADEEGPKIAAEKHGIAESLIYRWRAGSESTGKSVGNVEISSDGEFVTIRLPKKAVAKEILAGLI